MAQITICSCQLWLMWNSYTEEKLRLRINSPIILNTYGMCNRSSWPLWLLKRVRKRNMLLTQVWLLKKFWGSATIFLCGFAPVPPSGTWDTCPRERQMWMSSMSWAAQARARAPPLMILLSPTCHIFLACITNTLRFFSLNFPSSHYLSLLLLLFFFCPMGCWGKKNLKEHSAKFSRSKRSSAGDGPSPALPSATLSVLFSFQETAECVGLFCGSAVGLEVIRDRIKTIRLNFSWVQLKIWIQVFRKKSHKVQFTYCVISFPN